MAASNLWLATTHMTVTATPSASNQTLSANTHQIAFVFSAAATMTVTGLGIRLGTITGTTPTYAIELQTVDASGLPSGSAVASSTGTFSPSSLGWSAGTFNWVTVTGASITRGTMYALVVRYSSGTVDASNNASFTTSLTNVTPSTVRIPYALTDTGGGWTKATGIEYVHGYRDSSQTYGLPLESWTANTISSDGNRVTSKLSLAAGWGDTYQVGGLYIHGLTIPASGTVKFGVWNAAGTELASSGSVDSDQAGSTTIGVARLRFTSVATLNFGTTYYFGVERVATSACAVRSIHCGAARDLEAYPLGSAVAMSTWNGSAWSDTTTDFVPLSLLLVDWTEPTASGGGFLPIGTGGSIIRGVN